MSVVVWRHTPDKLIIAADSIIMKADTIYPEMVVWKVGHVHFDHAGSELATRLWGKSRPSKNAENVDVVWGYVGDAAGIPQAEEFVRTGKKIEVADEDGFTLVTISQGTFGKKPVRKTLCYENSQFALPWEDSAPNLNAGAIGMDGYAFGAMDYARMHGMEPPDPVNLVRMTIARSTHVRNPIRYVIIDETGVEKTEAGA
jgi:hypothetical protein